MTGFEDLAGQFRAPTPGAAVEPGPTMADLARAIEAADAQRAQHRTVICRPGCADRIRAALEAEGLAFMADVVESELVDEGQVLVARTPLDENGNPGWWPR